ncbi:MAG: EF-P lysine aminoacylase EpmA [Patescibacteria group bacterium]|nr:EF-P lysine aminoacylase EpmA [Patescibacteria group bacterium]
MSIENLKIRAEVIKAIRTWFENQGFIEMHTPRMVALPGQEPYLEPFWINVARPTSYVPRRVALVTSPEYAMKKLLGAGFDRIYDLGPCFRNNEPWDGSHDPEFLMLEFYRRESSLKQLMDDTESLITFVISKLRNSKFEIRNSIRRITVEEAWREYAGVELAPLLEDREAMAKLASEKFGQTVTEDDDWDDIYFKIFLSEIEPKIEAGEPTFLYRYPASMAALARRSADDERWADRVEFYAGGLELANGFAELSDPVEQRKRFEEEQSLRRRLGREVWDIDEQLLSALPKMGNAAGIAFGVDRFVMLICGAKSINDVVPFSASERL